MKRSQTVSPQERYGEIRDENSAWLKAELRSKLETAASSRQKIPLREQLGALAILENPLYQEGDYADLLIDAETLRRNTLCRMDEKRYKQELELSLQVSTVR